jgi:uncharacterized membrane protein YcaP (DUF421 family)
MFFAPVDWSRLFVPSAPLLETVLRGSVTYLVLLALLRFVFRRESGTAKISMLLLIVLLADAAQNAMAGDYTSITDGLILVATIMAWDYALDRLASRFRPFQTLIHPPPLLLVRDGRVLRDNMRREFVTEEELWSALRMHGIDSLADVRKAYMEGDGRLSVLPRKGRDRGTGDESSARASRR